MPSSSTTAADIVNASLVRIGWRQEVASLYDGSAAAQLALNIYGQTRDELLRKMNPGFAQRNAVLTLLKSAPDSYIPGVNPWDPTVNPPVNWLFEYAYPDSCLKVRAVKPTPLFFPNVDPQDNIFSIDNDNYLNPAQRVILCNVPNALVVYIGRVTDPATMDVGFIEALTQALGERLAPGLANLETAKMQAVEGQGETVQAMTEQG